MIHTDFKWVGGNKILRYFLGNARHTFLWDFLQGGKGIQAGHAQVWTILKYRTQIIGHITSGSYKTLQMIWIDFPKKLFKLNFCFTRQINKKEIPVFLKNKQLHTEKKGKR